MRKTIPLPSCERLNELFKYDPETGVLTRRKSVSGRRPKLPVGWLHSHGYLHVCVDRKSYKIHRIIWKMVNGSDPVGEIDHIDCNKSNNVIANLRCATKSQNKANTGLRKNNKSGFKGVSYCKRRDIWYAQITKHYKNINLGTFKTPEEAAQAYDKAAKREFGEFARTSKATGGE